MRGSTFYLILTAWGSASLITEGLRAAVDGEPITYTAALILTLFCYNVGLTVAVRARRSELALEKAQWRRRS